MVEHSVRDAGAAGSSPVIPIFQFTGASRRPLNEPSPLSLPLAPKNGLVPPKVFLICFCFFLDVTDYASPITVFDFWGLRLSPAWVVAPFFCHISDRRSFATLTWKSAALGRPFTKAIMGSLGRKIHSELLYGLPTTDYRSHFSRPSS